MEYNVEQCTEKINRVVKVLRESYQIEIEPIDVSSLEGVNIPEWLKKELIRILPVNDMALEAKNGDAIHLNGKWWLENNLKEALLTRSMIVAMNNVVSGNYAIGIEPDNFMEVYFISTDFIYCLDVYPESIVLVELNEEYHQFIRNHYETGIVRRNFSESQSRDFKAFWNSESFENQVDVKLRARDGKHYDDAMKALKDLARSLHKLEPDE